MARWLATDPKVLLLNDPTRGIDLGAKRDLYALLLSSPAEGLAVVMLSTEVDEHVELMDRVVVFREGAAFCELERGGLSRQALVSAFFGRGRGGARPCLTCASCCATRASCSRCCWRSAC